MYSNGECTIPMDHIGIQNWWSTVDLVEILRLVLSMVEVSISVPWLPSAPWIPCGLIHEMNAKMPLKLLGQSWPIGIKHYFWLGMKSLSKCLTSTGMQPFTQRIDSQQNPQTAWKNLLWHIPGQSLKREYYTEIAMTKKVARVEFHPHLRWEYRQKRRVCCSDISVFLVGGGYQHLRVWRYGQISFI